MLKQKTYVIHYCKNKKCNNAWVDVDLTKVKNIPPKWKLCRECCKRLGIDFETQARKSKFSEEQKKQIGALLTTGRENKQAKII